MGRRRSNDHLLKRYHVRHVIPAAVWLTTVAIVVLLFHTRAQRFQVLGIAQGQVRQVAANCDGRVRRVTVGLFERVEEGQVVAVVDTVLDGESNEAQLRAQLGTISAQIEYLAAQLVPTQDGLVASRTDREADRIADMHRFSVDVESARLRVLELKMQLATDRLTLSDLAVEVTINEDLVRKKALAAYELEKVKAQYDVVAKKVENNEEALEQAQTDFEQAQERLAAYSDQPPHYPSVEGALEVIRKAITVQERQMQEVSVELAVLEDRHSVQLDSPMAGVVSHIFRGPGEAVVAGEPILTLAEVEPTEVIGYARQGSASAIRENMRVEIVKTSPPAQVAESQITFVGPVVEQMPAQLWQNPNMPQWGRPFRIRIPPGFDVVPGEVVGVRGL